MYTQAQHGAFFKHGQLIEKLSKLTFRTMNRRNLAHVGYLIFCVCTVSLKAESRDSASSNLLQRKEDGGGLKFRQPKVTANLFLYLFNTCTLMLQNMNRVPGLKNEIGHV